MRDAARRSSSCASARCKSHSARKVEAGCAGCELAGILGGFARAQQHALASIAASWKDMYGVEATIATVPDQKLLDQFQTVAGLLTEGADAMGESADYAITAVPSSQTQQDAEWEGSRDASHVPVRVHQGHRAAIPQRDSARPAQLNSSMSLTNRHMSHPYTSIS
jgi:hypothetical protein